MKELVNDPKLVSFEISQTPYGILTTLKGPYAISHYGQSYSNGQSVIASHVYDDKRIFNLVYTQIAPDGSVTANYQDNGRFPTLFRNPAGDLWSNMVTKEPGKEQEISVPLFNRAALADPKPVKPFGDDFAGNIDNSSFFFDGGRLLKLEFSNGNLTNRTVIKLKPPTFNNIHICNNEMHLLAFDNDMLIHRQMDGLANLINTRTIPVNEFENFEIISMSFTGISLVLTFINDHFDLLEIDEKGVSVISQLVNVGVEIYTLYPAEKLESGAYLFRFVTEEGNGWMVIQKGQLIECFVTQEQGYKNIMGDGLIEPGNEEWILSGGNATSGNGYALVFYPSSLDEEKCKLLLVLQRQHI